jgi:hypothetical protein
MADAVIHELPEGVGAEQYDAVNQKLNVQGDPPGGLVAHFAGQGPNGRWRIVEVWDSRDQFDQFNRERLTPAIEEIAEASGREIEDADHSWWSVHNAYTR